MLNIRSNFHVRETVYALELPSWVLGAFDYLDMTNEDDQYREFVRYYGTWIDLSDVERAPDSVKAHGYDGMLSLTYSSAFLFRFFNKDGEPYENGVVCAYAYWTD